MELRGKLHIKILLGAIVVLIVLGYAYYRSYELIRGPQLEITSPKNGSTVANSFLAVEGRTENISAISVNDRPIFTNQEGQFRDHVLLSYGFNVIEVSARDRFGRSVERVLKLVYK